MLQQDEADDYVVATGQSHTLEDFVARAFDAVGLDWHDHVDSDPELMRPADLSRSRGDASKAADVLGWRASMAMPGVVKAMVAAERDPDPVL